MNTVIDMHCAERYHHSEGMSMDEKIANAKAYLGEAWVLHAVNKIKKFPKEYVLEGAKRERMIDSIHEMNKKSKRTKKKDTCIAEENHLSAIM